MYTLKSKLRDLYCHPVGYDVINKILLQAGLSKVLVENPVIGAFPLTFLKRIAGKKLGDGFFDALLALLNQS